METIDSLQWLRDNGLYDKAQEAATALKKVFTPCLGVQDEQLLIVGDTGGENQQVSAVLSGGYYLAAKELKLDAKLLLQPVKSRGVQAEDFVIEALTKLRGGVIILNMSDKLGSIGDLGKSFRRFVKKKGHRFVSAMSLGELPTDDFKTILDAIDISYKPVWTQHEALKKKFDEAKEIRVTTPAGTDLTYNIEGINGICADGRYLNPGDGGNLPAGEVYAPPNGNKVNGKVVIDGSARTHTTTILVKEPIILTIVDGTITRIEGGEEAKQLEETLRWATSLAKNPGGVRRICEFGIGLNPKARLLGAMIIDDKTLGTAHIGIGSNYWFGGTIYAIIHLDQVFKNPTVYFDGKKLER